MQETRCVGIQQVVKVGGAKCRVGEVCRGGDGGTRAGDKSLQVSVESTIDKKQLTCTC